MGTVDWIAALRDQIPAVWISRDNIHPAAFTTIEIGNKITTLAENCDILSRAYAVKSLKAPGLIIFHYALTPAVVDINPFTIGINPQWREILFRALTTLPDPAAEVSDTVKKHDCALTAVANNDC